MSYDEHVAEVYPAADGWRFRIKASNGEIIATGEAYESKAGATAGVERVHPGIAITYHGVTTEEARALDTLTQWAANQEAEHEEAP